MPLAESLYSRAVSESPPARAERAVYFGNRAAVRMAVGDHDAAVRDCSRALALQPDYVRVLVRRCVLPFSPLFLSHARLFLARPPFTMSPLSTVTVCDGRERRGDGEERRVSRCVQGHVLRAHRRGGQGSGRLAQGGGPGYGQQAGQGCHPQVGAAREGAAGKRKAALTGAIGRLPERCAWRQTCGMDQIRHPCRMPRGVPRAQEKLKEEMVEKLKGLGNSILGKFGLSLDNFKLQPNPSGEGYSIQFSQGGEGGSQ